MIVAMTFFEIRSVFVETTKSIIPGKAFTVVICVVVAFASSR